ncbi:hypothetical protein [Labrenzia sp. DG1229]|uniref:hypothetical protein n=1 Tax=Labrenzia sp. DG1229 TaxID=681847 RepID=UPI0012EB8FE1|nr:hypothetical protein [Labrenzia sp. DG1229]
MDSREPFQSRNVVQTARLTLIVIMLQICVNLAALLPGIAETLGLAGIFPSPFAQQNFQPGINPFGWKRRQRLVTGSEDTSHVRVANPE